MDLSKAYDCLPHDLLVGKLEAYGVGKAALNLISNYLSHRKQRTKIGSSYSDWYEIVRGVPQGSILGPLLLTYLLMISFFLLKRQILAILLPTIPFIAAVIIIYKLF